MTPYAKFVTFVFVLFAAVIIGLLYGINRDIERQADCALRDGQLVMLSGGARVCAKVQVLK